MRTKPSSTAHQPRFRSEPQIPDSLLHGPSVVPNYPLSAGRNFPGPRSSSNGCGDGQTSSEGVAHVATEADEGLLHDARNLISAVGLYCDLLSMPHVLQPEHRHYADELRLLGERSAAMIERLIERRSGTSREPLERAVGLRPAVERCAGLLGRIAERQTLEIAYGEAAALPVRVPAESIERILINLVRNAATALEGMRGAISIGVGLLPGHAGGVTRPWPFQRVQLSVEDTGRGMADAELKQLFGQHASPSVGHGIGFRVVRELVESSGGQLTVDSLAGRGTRIEMEWPVAQTEEQPAVPMTAPELNGERRRTAWQS